MNDDSQTPDAPLDYAHFLVGMALLTSNYPPRGASDAGADALLAAWWRVLEPRAGTGDGRVPGRWITNALFAEAVDETLTTGQGYLPAVGEFLEVCRVCKQFRERDAGGAAALGSTPALPVPAVVDVTQPPAGFGRDTWDRNVAIGKARQRKRNARIAAWRATNPHGWPPNWPQGDFHPTDAEIDAVLREMAGNGLLKGTLDAALAVRVPIAIGVGEHSR